MQGWTPDFIPKLTDDAVAMKVIDRILPISGPDAIRCSKELATKEGIFVGITSGATLRRRASRLRPRRRRAPTFSACFPIPASVISSTPLFADVSADMNEEELEDFALDAGRAARVLSS